MAKKNLNGQMSMFDYFRSLEKEVPANGDVEMVSLIPEEVSEFVEKENDCDEIYTEKKEVLEKDLVLDDVVMQKEIIDKNGVVDYIISYANYNKVIIKNKENIVNIHEFDSSKDAVDFYIEQISLLKKSE